MRIVDYTWNARPDSRHVFVIASVANGKSIDMPKAITTETAYDTWYDTVHPMWVHDTCTMIPSVLPSSLPKRTQVWFPGSITVSTAPEGTTWLVGTPGDTITLLGKPYRTEWIFGHSSITRRSLREDGSKFYPDKTLAYRGSSPYEISLSAGSIIRPSYDSLPGTGYMDDLVRFEHWDPQALTAKALDQYQGLNINTASYIKEIPTVLRTLTETVRSVKAAMHGDVKQLASAYLGNKYGTQNTIRDTVDIVKYVNGSHRTCSDSLHGSASFNKSGSLYSVTVRDGCTIRVNPVSRSVFDSTIDALRQIDLLPSLENAWDMVPYSFVIDWIVPIGDILSSIDKSADLARLDVKDCFYSRLIEYQSVASWGVCRRTHFARYSSTPVSPIGVDSYSSGNISNHFLETSALIVQRTK